MQRYGAVLYENCEKRAKTLEILAKYGFNEFVDYVREHKIALYEDEKRQHCVWNRAYLLRNEILNDSLLVKAILDKHIDSNIILTLIKYDTSFRSMPNLSFPLKEFIKVTNRNSGVEDILPYNIINDITKYLPQVLVRENSARIVLNGTIIKESPGGPTGKQGVIGAGDDGYGGSIFSPHIKQYLNDPYSLLLALFVRGDSNLIDEILKLYPQLYEFIPGTFEIFLIDKTSGQELERISKYITVPYAYHFASQWRCENLDYLKCHGFQYYINAIFEIDPWICIVWK